MSKLSGSVNLPSLSQIHTSPKPMARPELIQAPLALPSALNRSDSLQLQQSSPSALPSVSYLLTVQELRNQEGYLKFGDKSDAVGFVQERLQKWGHSVEVDQKFGEQTFNAVSDFQRKHGLSVSGMVGQDTLNALELDPIIRPRPRPLPPLPSLPGAVPNQDLSLVRSGQAYLQSGDEGNDVSEIQTLLKARGYAIEVDSQYGDLTASAVAQFQRDHNIQANGMVGQTTLSALEAKPAPAPQVAAIQQGLAELNAGSAGPAVEYIQQRLQAYGYSVSVDSDFGPKTSDAVRAFQRDHNIQPNGRIGQTTLAALETAPPPNLGRVTSTARGNRLGQVAKQVANRRGTTGWCYAGAADSISRALGVQLWGKSAYMATDILRQKPGFREYKNIKPADLPKLPAGAIIVWGKTSVSKHGHISISLGDGREASDHVARQRTQLRGHTNFTVFMPQ